MVKCKMCKEEIKGQIISVFDWGWIYYCDKCYIKYRDNELAESWKYHMQMLGLSEIHCIKCTSKITIKMVIDSDEDTIKFHCYNCQFEF
ncbi:MAG: hypothetical protein ACFFCI_23825, partial [Promethearchaeota archaeon]